MERGEPGKQRNPWEPEEGAEKRAEPGSFGSKESLGSESRLVSLESEGNLGSGQNLRSEGRLERKESMGNLDSLESVRGEQCFFPHYTLKFPRHTILWNLSRALSLFHGHFFKKLQGPVLSRQSFP